jgi:uncharacterized protein YcfL
MTTACPNVTSLLRAAAAAALASAVVAGCGSVNTTYTRDRPADTAVDARTRVNDLLQQIFLSAKEVRMFRNSQGVMEVQVDVENNGFSYRSFSYLFDWVDARGNVMPSQLSVWKTTNVPDGGSTVIRAIAPDEKATDFRLQIRRSD